MLNTDKVKILAKQNGITVSYVCAQIGQGRGYMNDVAKNNIHVPAPKIQHIADMLNTTVEYLTDETDDPTRPEEKDKPVRLPVLGNIAAGIPLEQIIDTFADDWEEIPAQMARGGTYFALRINGDSMSPIMMRGDIVIVRAQEDVEDGETALVTVGSDNAIFRKIKKMSDGIMLISHNLEYAPIVYSKDEVNSLPVRILGKAVELRRKFL